MQATAHFLIWTIALQVLIGFALAFLINKKFRGNDLWTTIIVFPMMLSPAVVGNFWTFLVSAADWPVQLRGRIFYRRGSCQFLDDWRRVRWRLGPSSLPIPGCGRRFVMLICLAGLRSIPDSIYEAAECDRASKWRQFWTITLPMALPFLMLAVLFRGIENFKMFDLVVQLTGGGPGNTTTLTSIDLKREAFEKWRTGYSSAYAVILFVTVFGLASIYVKALNKVKER